MSRTSEHARAPWRSAFVVVVAALALAGCGSVAKVVAPPHLSGTPSISIEVPLQSVACTTSGACIAAGGDGANVAPSSTAEVRHADGSWSAITVPSTLSQSITSSACWSNECVIGGSQPSGDSLWIYDPATQSVATSSTPRAGRGVSALSCYAVASCAVVDTTRITGGSRLSFTSDGGTTWTTPLPLTWTVGDGVTALSCTDADNCLVAATNSNHQALLEVTHDAGATWSARTMPTTWTNLSSLTCAKLDCVALASTTGGSLFERSSTFARLWRGVKLANSANALACVRLSRCALVGQTNDQSPWLATLKGRRVANIALTYVPSALVDVACGAKTCAAIGVSTVLSLQP
jgi:hypothetical protein